jgi:methionyl aminopeptidase
MQEVIKNHGFKTVSNLTGHQVGRYLIHVGNLLPNVHRFTLTKIKSGEVYGVEPFVTTSDAAGVVEHGVAGNIFRFLKKRSHKNPYVKKLQNYIRKNFYTLPFSERWLQQILPRDKYKMAFSNLLSSHIIMSYPVFIEASRNPVAQAEHTILIIDDGCLVLT